MNDEENGSYTTSVFAGTYSIHVDGNDTGQKLSVSMGGANETTLDYYTLTLNAGIGIDSVTGGGVYLAGEQVSISATVSSGYTWNKWVVSTTGAEYIAEKNTSITMPSNTLGLTATATQNTFVATVYLNLDNKPLDGKSVELFSEGTSIAAMHDEEDGSYTASVFAETYSIHVDGSDTGKKLSVSMGGANETTLDYYTLTLTTDTGIDSVTGGGVYLADSQVSISATVSSGYTWSKWVVSTTSAEYSVEKNTSITMPSSPLGLTATATQKLTMRQCL
jgi:hypothetical protein